jgi:hypothetical protein
VSNADILLLSNVPVRFLEPLRFSAMARVSRTFLLFYVSLWLQLFSGTFNLASLKGVRRAEAHSLT